MQREIVWNRLVRWFFASQETSELNRHQWRNLLLDIRI